MRRDRACDIQNPNPIQPRRGAIARCENCAENVRSGELDESATYKWKTLENYPEKRACPDCGEIIHSDPQAAEIECSGNNAVEDHGKFCCACGTWLYNPANTDTGGWKCPNEACSAR